MQWPCCGVANKIIDHIAEARIQAGVTRESSAEISLSCRYLVPMAPPLVGSGFSEIQIDGLRLPVEHVFDCHAHSCIYIQYTTHA